MRKILTAAVAAALAAPLIVAGPPAPAAEFTGGTCQLKARPRPVSRGSPVGAAGLRRNEL